MTGDMKTDKNVTEVGLLRLQVADLKYDMEVARADAAAQRERREEVERSRDAWASVARTLGLVGGDTARLVDDDLAREHAMADARRARTRQAEVEDRLRQAEAVIDGLVAFVRRVPKLPVPVGGLRHDELRALVWALSEHVRTPWTKVELADADRAKVLRAWQRIVDANAAARAHQGDTTAHLPGGDF